MKKYQNKEPFFSIILTSFNRSKLILRAINSVVEQDFNNWELIIIDDGSSDNTYEIVKPIIELDQRISYHFQKNQGSVKAKNSALRFTKGDYISYLDSDDEYLKNHLQIRYDLLNKNDDLDLIHGGVEIIGERFVPDINDNSKMIDLDDCIIGGSFIIKSDLLVKLGGLPEERYGADHLLYEKMKSLGYNIVKTDIKTYIYHREHEESITKNING